MFRGVDNAEQRGHYMKGSYYNGCDYVWARLFSVGGLRTGQRWKNDRGG